MSLFVFFTVVFLDWLVSMSSGAESREWVNLDCVHNSWPLTGVGDANPHFQIYLKVTAGFRCMLDWHRSHIWPPSTKISALFSEWLHFVGPPCSGCWGPPPGLFYLRLVQEASPCWGPSCVTAHSRGDQTVLKMKAHTFISVLPSQKWHQITARCCSSNIPN